MGDCPNTKPLATNEVGFGDLDDDDDEENNDDASSVGSSNALKDINNQAGSTPTSSISSNKTGSRKRLTATKEKKTKKTAKTEADTLVSDFLGDSKFQEWRQREVEAREKEATARMMAAQATAAKSAEETALLSVQAKAALLRERHKLREEGIPQEDIDAMPPLPSK